ncbi:MAG: sigma-70 family RNA polymerase sigma factor [Sandaracinus sp.]
MELSSRQFGRGAEVARPALDPEREATLLTAAQAGDRNAQAELVLSHMRLVRAVARRVAPAPSEDTIAEGVLGLLEAIHRFDTTRGARLATYAAHWIRARVQRFVLANRGIVGAPDTRASRRVFGRLGRVQRELATRTSEPRLEELATALGVTERDVEGVLACLRNRDVPLDGLSSATDLESTTSPEQTFGDAELAAARRRVIDRALSALPHRERHVLEARALADDAATLDQLAAALDLSRERVRQLETRALRRIGDALVVEGLAA